MTKLTCANDNANDDVDDNVNDDNKQVFIGKNDDDDDEK